MTMFPHTVTVMNKVDTYDGVVYKPSVLVGVLFTSKKASSKILEGLGNKNTMQCTIPFGVVCDKPFTDPLVYSKLTEEEKDNYWTLREDDIIIKSIITDSSLTLKKISSVYDRKMVVLSVDTLDFGSLQHWQVGGA